MAHDSSMQHRNMGNDTAKMDMDMEYMIDMDGNLYGKNLLAAGVFIRLYPGRMNMKMQAGGIDCCTGPYQPISFFSCYM